MSMEDIDDDEFDPEAYEREGSATPVKSPDPKSAPTLEKAMPPKDKHTKKEEVGRAGPATKGYIALTKEEFETDWYAARGGAHRPFGVRRQCPRDPPPSPA